jgi:hypothetical protein
MNITGACGAANGEGRLRRRHVVLPDRFLAAARDRAGSPVISTLRRARMPSWR